uniref:hypothetical protein n=1 Tax=Kluyvera sichuanensis TaxID=2725494 RepID=UPI003F5E03FE
MPVIISLLYLVIGFFIFTRKIKLSKLISTFLLFLSLYILPQHSFLILIYTLIIIIVTLFFYRLTLDLTRKETLYFSMPCWFVVLSIVLNVFYR